MNIWLLGLGLLIVVFIAIDVVMTTFAPSGSGIFAGRLQRGIWNTFLWLSGKSGKRTVLNYAGPLTVVTWLLYWLFMVWAGNALIVLSDEDSVVEIISSRSTTWLEKIYYTGYTMSTLGNGEFIPHGSGWQLYAAFLSFNGFMLLTITITYLYSVVTSDINRRKVSLKIYYIGSTPQEILLRFWNGRDFSRLNTDLSTLSDQILQLAQNHRAYPVLHNFHSSRQGESLAINIAVLDEALTLLLLYKPKDVRPSLAELYLIRSAVTHYLQTLHEAFIKPAKEDPPAPRLHPLLANDLPLHGEPFDRLVSDDLRLRRKLLCGLLHSQGWDWSVVEGQQSKDPLDDWLTTMRKERLYEWPRPGQSKEGRDEQLRQGK